jgi:hypothetical protein
MSAVKFPPVALPTHACGMRPPESKRGRRFTAASAACCAFLLLLVQAPGCKGAQDVVTPPNAVADLAVSSGLRIPANLKPATATTASDTRVLNHTSSAAANLTLGATAARDGLTAALYRGRRLAAGAAEPEVALLMTSSMAAASTKQSLGEWQRPRSTGMKSAPLMQLCCLAVMKHEQGWRWCSGDTAVWCTCRNCNAAAARTSEGV